MMLLALICCLTGAKAQEVVYSPWGFPFDSWYKYSYCQQIFYPEQIGNEGLITSITLWLKGYKELPEIVFDIYMVETDKDDFDNKEDWIPVTADDKVYSGSINVQSSELKEFTFRLTSPHLYRGGNLMIAFNNITGDCYNEDEIGLGGKALYSSSGCTLMAYTNARAYDPTNPTFSANRREDYINDITFDITPIPASSVTVGDPTKGYYGMVPLPTYPSNSYSYCQQIFSKEDLNNAFGTITSITMWLKTSYTRGLPIDIYMKEVDRDKFKDNADWEPMTDDDKVFSGKWEVKANSANGDSKEYTLQLDKPFQYSGKGHLLIAFNKTNINDGGGVQGNYEKGSGYRTIWSYRSSQVYDPSSPPYDNYSDLTAISWRNVIKFTFVPLAEMAVGSGTGSGSCVPIDTWYNYSMTQQIYTTEELGGAATFLSVGFHANQQCTRNLDIYMMSTDKSSFSSDDDWENVAAGDLVFSGKVTFAKNDWTTIMLDNPFEYDGQHNVVLLVDDNTGRRNSSIIFNTYDTENQSLHCGKDNYDIDPAAPPSNSKKTIEKNQLHLLKTKVPAVMKPQHLRVTDLMPTYADISWEGEGSSYYIEYGTDQSTIQKTITGKSLRLSNLDYNTTYKVRVSAYKNGSYSSDATMTFKTPAVLSAPTKLAVRNVTPTSADMSWEGYQNKFEYELTVPEHVKRNAFTRMGNDLTATSEWTSYSFDLSGYNGTGAIAIRYYKSGAGIPVSLYLDDIEVTNANGVVVLSNSFDSGSLPDTWKSIERYYSYSDHPTSSWDVSDGNVHSFVYSYSDMWLIIPDVPLGGRLTLRASAKDAADDLLYDKAIFAVYVSPTGETIVPSSTITGTANSENCTLTGLEGELTYQFKVRGLRELGGGVDRTAWSTLSFTTPDYLLGDVNASNDITPADAIMILYNYFNVMQTGFIEDAADVNLDGAISPADAIEALYIYFGAGTGTGSNARATRPKEATCPEPE